MSKAKPKVLLVLGDGVGARHFLMSPFPAEMRERAELEVMHGMPREHEAEFPVLADGGVRTHRTLPHRDTKVTSLLRQTLQYAQIYWANTEAMRMCLDLPIPGGRRGFAKQKTLRLAGRAAASPRRMNAMADMLQNRVSEFPEVRHYCDLLREIKPSVVFFTNQRKPEALMLVLAARELRIPTATFVFSWDNLTVKGRVAAPFDHYLVWSDLMRDELLRYYPHTDPRAVHVVGTPQFEPGVDTKQIMPRDEFFRLIGADPSRPLICYSGGDVSTCPEDPDHAGALMDLISSGTIRHRPQLLVRPAPVDASGRYEAVCRKYPEMIFAQPKWIHVGGGWQTVVPTSEDVRFLVNLTEHVSVNVNMASTMTLDFSVRDTPVVNVAFDVAQPPVLGTPVWDMYYRFEHYRPVVEIGAARFARSKTELGTHVNAYLDDPSLDRAERKKLVELETGPSVHGASERVAQALEAISLN